MADLTEILFEDEEQLTDEELLKYLDENTPDEEKYAIEKKVASAGFENDAIEGLQKIKKPEQLQKHVKQLNKKLRQQLSHKKQRAEKGKVLKFRWILLTLLILLFICVVGYVVIRLHGKGRISTNRSSQLTELQK